MKKVEPIGLFNKHCICSTLEVNYFNFWKDGHNYGEGSVYRVMDGAETEYGELDYTWIYCRIGLAVSESTIVYIMFQSNSAIDSTVVKRDTKGAFEPVTLRVIQFQVDNTSYVPPPSDIVIFIKKFEAFLSIIYLYQ